MNPTSDSGGTPVLRKRPWAGPLTLSFALLAVVLGTLLPFACSYRQASLLPSAISKHGQIIDAQIYLTLWITGFFFLAAHGLLAWLIWRYRDFGRLVEVPRERPVWVWSTVVVAGLMVLAVDVGLNLVGQDVWANLHLRRPPADSVEVGVTGFQFRWAMHYAGNDGQYGARDLRRAAKEEYKGNYLGLNYRKDAASRDDLQRLELKLPWDTPVVLQIYSRDVLHSFFIRELRIKQDAVPGLAIPIPFTIERLRTEIGRLPAGEAQDLDSGTLTPRLRGCLEAARVHLPQRAEVRVEEKGAGWMLVDGAAPEDVYARVRLAEAGLQVFRTRYEIACAELCGQGHYQMSSVLEVMPRSAFDRWLNAASVEESQRHSP